MSRKQQEHNRNEKHGKNDEDLEKDADVFTTRLFRGKKIIIRGKQRQEEDR